MKKTTKSLRLTFKNSENKKVNLSLADAKPDLNEQEARSAMGQISQAGVFERDGVVLYHEPDAAAYVERTVTSIFDTGAAGEDKQ